MKTRAYSCWRKIPGVEGYSFNLFHICFGRNILGFQRYFLIGFCNFGLEFYWQKIEPLPVAAPVFVESRHE